MKAEVADDDEEAYHDYDSSTEIVTNEIPMNSTYESNDKVINDVKPCKRKAFGWLHKNNIGIIYFLAFQKTICKSSSYDFIIYYVFQFSI